MGHWNGTTRDRLGDTARQKRDAVSCFIIKDTVFISGRLKNFLFGGH